MLELVKNLRLGFVVIAIALLASLALILALPERGNRVRDLPAPPAAEKEWTLPALFEGEGAITVGCQFWQVPKLTPYSAENPDAGYVYLTLEGLNASPGDVGLVVDGPQGTAILVGSRCGISIDWRRFPTDTRPADPLPTPRVN